MTDREPAPAFSIFRSIDADAPVTKREIWFVYAGFMVIMGLSALDQSIVATALPRIVSDLGGVAYLSWVVTAYVLASTSVMPLYGKLSDQYGRKPLIYAAVAIFLIGSLLCALSQTMLQLIVFRIVQGIGAGGLVPLSQIIIADLIPPRERGRYQGNIAIVFAVATVGGPALGGFITDALSWHWIFLINLPIGLIAFLMIALTLRRRSVTKSRDIDYGGAVLLTCATTSLLLVMSLGGVEWPWASPQIFGVGVMALVFAALFVWRENRAAEPIMPMLLFRNRLFVLATVATAFSFLGMQGASLYYPLLYQMVYGVEMANSGWLTAPMMIGIVIAARVNGQVMYVTGRYKPMQIAGLAFGVVVFAGLTFATASAQPVWVIAVSIFLVGLCFGLVNPNMVVAVQNAMPSEHMGAATATLSFFRSLGGVAGVAACGAIITARLAAEFAGASVPGGDELLKGGIVQVQALAPEVRAVVVDNYRRAIAAGFALSVVATIVALGFAIAMPEKVLNSRLPRQSEQAPSRRFRKS